MSTRFGCEDISRRTPANKVGERIASFMRTAKRPAFRVRAVAKSAKLYLNSCGLHLNKCTSHLNRLRLGDLSVLCDFARNLSVAGDIYGSFQMALVI
jgi:hypothetical protein